MLKDFGLPVVYGGLNTTGILDQHDASITDPGMDDSALGRWLTLTVVTGSITPALETTISVGGIVYQIRNFYLDAPDGAFTQLVLQR